jgi:electron transfer flavoprotein alpha subunit
VAEVLILVERSHGGIRKASLQLLTLARRLGEPAALICGALDDATTDTLGAYGATKVYVVEGPELHDLLVVAQVDALVTVARQSAPAAVLVTSGPESREVAARAAVRLDSGIITDAVDVEPGDGGPLVTQSVFAGSWSAQSQVVRGTPIIAVRPNAVIAETAPAQPVVEAISVAFGDSTRATRVASRTAKTSTGRPDLADAHVVVAGGRGLGSPEAFHLVDRLADTLGGAVGASRAATDLQWCGRDYQIGQTGNTVTPALYIACGISGAIQHRAGMQGSRTIVAVNKDPKAPIFAISDFGVVGDVHTVLPALVDEIESRKTSAAGTIGRDNV